MRKWRAGRQKKIDDPKTPPEEKARLQAQLDRHKAQLQKANCYVSYEDAERVLNDEEMANFITLRAAKNRFRRANRAMKKTMQKARRDGRPLTEQELKDWDDILAGLRAYAKAAREVARRLDKLDRYKGIGGWDHPPSRETKTQNPKAPTEEDKPPHKGFSLDLTPPALDDVNRYVQKMGSNLGNAFQRASTLHRVHPDAPLHPFGPRPLAPHVVPVLKRSVDNDDQEMENMATPEES